MVPPTSLITSAAELQSAGLEFSTVSACQAAAAAHFFEQDYETPTYSVLAMATRFNLTPMQLYPCINEICAAEARVVVALPVWLYALYERSVELVRAALISRDEHTTLRSICAQLNKEASEISEAAAEERSDHPPIALERSKQDTEKIEGKHGQGVVTGVAKERFDSRCTEKLDAVTGNSISSSCERIPYQSLHKYVYK